MKVHFYVTPKPGNSIEYLQDFSMHRGLPAGVRFSVYHLPDGRYRLIAPGHGAKSDYGNGMIFVGRARPRLYGLTTTETKEQ